MVGAALKGLPVGSELANKEGVLGGAQPRLCRDGRREHPNLCLGSAAREASEGVDFGLATLRSLFETAWARLGLVRLGVGEARRS